MIPAIAPFLERNFEIKKQPTQTYRMDMENRSVQGYTDGLEAMKQVIHKIILTERYQYMMYSWNYGIELLDLMGEPVSYVCPELEYRITEALQQDDRIEEVDGFEFEVNGSTVKALFTVHTVFGNLKAEREVDI